MADLASTPGIVAAVALRLLRSGRNLVFNIFSSSTYAHLPQARAFTSDSTTPLKSPHDDSGSFAPLSKLVGRIASAQGLSSTDMSTAAFFVFLVAPIHFLATSPIAFDLRKCPGCAQGITPRTSPLSTRTLGEVFCQKLLRSRMGSCLSDVVHGNGCFSANPLVLG